MNKAAKEKSAEVLADEIFTLVQDAQDKGFLSDGLNAIADKKKLFGIVRWHLRQTERAARIMRTWLKKYGEL